MAIFVALTAGRAVGATQAPDAPYNALARVNNRTSHGHRKRAAGGGVQGSDWDRETAYTRAPAKGVCSASRTGSCRADPSGATEAIEEAAAAFRAALNSAWLEGATLVPIPPSKAKGDALYDDRLVRMVRGIRVQPQLDVRELVLQRASTVAVHDQENRPTPEQIQANYAIDQAIRDPNPQVIGYSMTCLRPALTFVRPPRCSPTTS